MGDLKLCSFFTGGKNSVEQIKGEFESHPHGMSFDAFCDFLNRCSSKRKSDNGNSVKLLHKRSYKTTVSEEPSVFRGGQLLSSVHEGENGRNSIAHSQPIPLGGSASVSPPINETLGNSQDAHTLHRSLYSNSSSCPFSAASRSCKIKDWSDLRAVETLFHKIDGDNDGYVTWDDALQVAVEEATQSITVMTEEMRSYSFSRISPRMKLIQSIHALDYHNSLFAVVTRSNPLTLMSKRTMADVRTFSAEDLGHTHPNIVEYLPLPDVLLAYSACDKTIRGWWGVVSSNRMGTLNPLKQEYGARRIRLRPNVFPYSLFVAGSQGVISQFQVPKQRSVLDISQVRSYKDLHNRESGGITDFAITDESLLSTGFDHRLLSTNLETGRSILIGRPTETIRLVEYNRTYACLPSVSYSNKVLLWDVRSSAVTPNSAFRDDKVKPHLTDVIGLSNATGLPYAITADVSGLLKIWDFRMLGCVQTIYADGSMCDVLGTDLSYGAQDSHNSKVSLSQSPARYGETRSIRSLCYFGGSQEIVCCSAERITCVRYNHRIGGDAADLDTVCYACHDIRQGTFILQSATRISVWDAAEGYRKRVSDRATDSTVPYWQKEILALCIDQARSRVFLAVADGFVEVHSSKTLTLIESFRIHDSAICEMIYSQKHKILVTIAVNGTLSVRLELETGSSLTTLSFSSQPLKNLTMSEKVGIVACCDVNYLYVLDIKLTRLIPHVIKTERPVNAMLLLGSYPVIVTGDERGQLIFRSTVPVEETRDSLGKLELGETISDSFGDESAPNVHWERGERSTICTPTSQGTTYIEKTNISTGAEGMPPAQRSSGPTKSTKSSGFEEIINIIAMDERSTNGICALACDDVTHRLFVADRTGKLYIISLCAFIEAYGLQKSVFEHRTRYRLNNITAEQECSLFTVLFTISLSKCYVNYLAWFPGLSLLIACDTSRLVRIFDNNGNETGQLLMDRLPPKNMMDVVDEASFGKNYEDANLMASMADYSLPNLISISSPCPDCVQRRAKSSIKPLRPLGEDLLTHSELFSPVDEPRAQTAPPGEKAKFPSLQESQVEIATVLPTKLRANEHGSPFSSGSPKQRKCSFHSCPRVEGEREIVARDRKLRRVIPDKTEQGLSTALIPHLVDLEEKRQLRPQKEKECAFWLKKDMSPTVMGTNTDFLCPSIRTFSGAFSCTRSGSCDAFTSTGGTTNSWWKTSLDLPSQSSSKTNHRSVDFEASTVERNLLSMSDAAQASSGNLVPTGTATAPISHLTCGVTIQQRLRKTQNLKRVKKQTDAGVQNEVTPLINVVRAYDKELRQCIRGKRPKDSTHRNGGTVSSTLMGLQPIVLFDKKHQE